MSFDKTYNLLEKYFNGETSLQEEQVLKAFFLGTEELPETLQQLKNQFLAFEKSATEQLDESFDQKILEAIGDSPLEIEPKVKHRKKQIVRKHPFSYTLSAIAASILILLTIWTTTDLFNRKKASFINEKTALAYQQTSDVLSILAINFDKGLATTRMAAKPLNTSIKMLKNVEKINKGLEMLQPVSNLQNMEIIKNNK